VKNKQLLRREVKNKLIFLIGLQFFKKEVIMRRGLILVALIIVMLPALLLAQQMVINNFDTAPADTNYWAYFDNHGGQHYQTSDNADSAKGWIKISYIDNPLYEGAGAMKLEWSAHNIESWGGYTKLEHWNPDSLGVYDWSAYDSLVIWYYNEVPSSTPSTVHLRINLHDVSDSENGAKTYSVLECEYYYSFHYILDNPPGWNRISIPLKDGRSDPTLDEWGGGAFNRTGWSGIEGNDQLDLDKIKGFSLEFSIGGAGEGNAETGTIILDHMALTGYKVLPIVFFNGKTLSSKLNGFTWGQSTFEIVEGEGATAGTNAMKWVQGNEWGNGWTGIGWNISPALNMTSAWRQDSLKFKMKVDAGVDTLRWQFESGADKAGYKFDPIDDGNWHQYSLALSDFSIVEGATLDTSAIGVLQIMAEGNSVAGNTIYIDDLWTGNPTIDVVAPAPPTGVNAVVATYYNLVIWQDVPGESDEVYNVYASKNPITDVSAEEVELIAANVGEDIQTATHWLYYPLTDTEVSYYYAVTCTDGSGNTSEPGTTAGLVTNTAKGIPTISLNPPVDFAADGDLSEWDASGIVPFTLSPEDNNVFGDVDDFNDLSANIYMAIDDDALYVAADVIDDVYNFGTGDWWNQDAFQMFLGLYNQVGPTHKSLKRGEEPDYVFYANEEGFTRDYAGMGKLWLPEDENYYFSDLGGADYVVEIKIPLDSIPAVNPADSRFHPVRGMKVPFELYLHDNDGTWEGNLGLSPNATDLQWSSVQQWTYTWIGDTAGVATSVERNPELRPADFQLVQNYPNPFNPTTTIQYRIPVKSHVILEIYNVQGRKIRTLLDSYEEAGLHSVEFNASDLSSGVYFYRINAGDFSEMKKMILMK